MRSILSFLLMIATAFSLFAQAGPAAGSLSSGTVKNTNDFSTYSESSGRIKLFNKVSDPIDEYKPTGLESLIYVDDHAFNSNRADGRDSVIIYQDFGGIPQTSSIPPDPYIAVGPDHIIETVNTSWRITDKDGNAMATIDAGQWFSYPGKNFDPFDPKVIYDHHNQRWVQVWLHADDGNSEAYFLFSVSDDSDPNGVWYNWALPSDQNGNTFAGNWADYQGVGYDDKAIYLTSNQFTFGSNASYQYSKLRIVPSADLYQGSAGEVTWNDFWNIYDFGLRPVRTMDVMDKSYMVRTFQNGGAYIYVYEINDPVGSPTLSKSLVQVNPYGGPPLGNQLGGNQYESGGANLRNEPVVQDGVIHFAHAVSMGSYSAVRYCAFDASTNTVVKDMAMGTGTHYYSYPALAVAENNDVVISYSRSSSTEYIGSYFTVVKADANEPLGSFQLQDGKANYFKTFGGTRNRWGDYNGAWTDPKDPNNVWVYAEYVAAANTWGNWLAGVRTSPFDNATINTSTSEIVFGDVEVAFESDVVSFTLRNYGKTELSISGISNANSDLVLQTQLSFPVTLSAYDSVLVEYKFIPSEEGALTDEITITSNDPNYPATVVNASGIGYMINSPSKGKLLGLSSASNDLIDINFVDGSAEELGSSVIDEQRSLAYNPESEKLWAIVSEADGDDEMTSFIRVNGTLGDSYVKFTLPYFFDAVTFDSAGTLWGISNTNNLLTIDLVNESPFLQTSLEKGFSSLAYNKADGLLYGGIHEDSTDNDRIYTINPTDGTLTLLGQTGQGRSTAAMAFDSEGNLYASVIKSFANSYLYSVDLATAAATEIGKIGSFKSVEGLVFTADSVTSLRSVENNIPSDFSLGQNYPNPFNPSTTLTFALPVEGNVKLAVYNSIGEEVAVLVNNYLKAGTYNYSFNTANGNFSSGVYFYTITVEGAEGNRFNESKKMILLK
ncbi:MAG: hypothetical protein SCALA702_08900 [Melioribacteraceae bacterium]|nr:MAG: hypothetical protein SCALA702_08900 [Melioribacteraceae bacterium]